MTTDETMRAHAVPGVLVEGRPAPADLGAERWVVRIIVGGDVNDPLGDVGTGFILSPQWVLTARHVIQSKLPNGQLQTFLNVWAKVRQRVSMHISADPTLGAMDGGLWFDDVIFGVGDVAALHVAEEFQPNLQGRQAPVSWDFRPSANRGAITTLIGFLRPTRLGAIDGKITGVLPGRAPYRGVQVYNGFSGNGGRPQHGDSGGPVLANVQGVEGLQVVGVNNGASGTESRYWTPLTQEGSLMEKVQQIPVNVAWGPPFGGVGASAAAGDDASPSLAGTRVAVCRYKVGPSA